MRTLTRPGTYRPPRGGEPSRLREDGHWSTRGLVGYWPMNEGRGSVVQDVAQNTVGQRTGNSGWADGPTGQPAAYCDGTTDWIQTGLQVGSPDTMTISLRARLRSDVVTNQYLVDSSIGGNGYIIRTRLTGGINQLDAYFFRATGLSSMTAVAVTVGQWMHVAAVMDTGQCRFYIDNILYRTNSVQSGPLVAGATMAIAAEFNGSNKLDCDVASIGVYSRALSADEIAALYRDPYLPLWRPRMGISLAMLTPAAGLPLITSRTLGRIGPSLRGLR